MGVSKAFDLWGTQKCKEKKARKDRGGRKKREDGLQTRCGSGWSRGNLSFERKRFYGRQEAYGLLVEGKEPAVAILSYWL